MQKWYRELGDHERLILAQLPEERPLNVWALWDEWELEKDVRRKSGLSNEVFRETLDVLMKKGLVEREQIEHTVVSRTLPARVTKAKSFHLRRSGKAVKKTHKRYLS